MLGEMKVPAPIVVAPGRGRATTASGLAHHSSTGSVVLRNARGQVVGAIRSGWLRKRVVTTRHRLRRPQAWCIDVGHMAALEALGAEGVLLVDETGTEWRATVEDFRRYGVALNRGCGDQVALPLRYWRRSLPGQLPLWGMGE